MTTSPDPLRHRPYRSTRRRRQWWWVLLLSFLVGAGLGLVGYSAWNHSLPWQGSPQDGATSGTHHTSPPAASDSPTTPAPTPSNTPTPTPTQHDATFTILAAGDVLPHMPVDQDAHTADGGYDFLPMLSGIDGWVQGADLAICHMEVPVAPPGTSPSGYPVFGAPAELVRDLHRQGWDGCSTASNHSVDRGFAGIQATTKAFDKHHLGHTGTFRRKRSAQQPQVYVLQRGGQKIRIAHISAAYGTNGIPLPQGKPWSVNLIDTDAIIAEARQARADGADLVVVSIHAGTEYVTQPTTQQKEVDSALAKSGEVDLVIGHHAHVPQPIVKLPGGAHGHGMWAAYGLGNLVSNQDSACCSPKTDSGLMMIATVKKPVDGPARVSKVRWEGVTVDRTGGHKVYPFNDVLDRSSGVGKLSHTELEQRYTRVKDAVGDQAKEAKHAPKPTGSTPRVVRRH